MSGLIPGFWTLKMTMKRFLEQVLVKSASFQLINILDNRKAIITVIQEIFWTN